MLKTASDIRGSNLQLIRAGFWLAAILSRQASFDRSSKQCNSNYEHIIRGMRKCLFLNQILKTTNNATRREENNGTSKRKTPNTVDEKQKLHQKNTETSRQGPNNSSTVYEDMHYMAREPLTGAWEPLNTRELYASEAVYPVYCGSLLQ